MTILATPLQFRDWLESEHPLTILGNVLYPTRCPIAIFLKERGYRGVEVNATSIKIGNKTFEMPEWVHGFYYLSGKTNTGSAFKKPEPTVQDCWIRLNTIEDIGRD